MIFGILFIIIGLIILGLTIAKCVREMRNGKPTSKQSYNNSYDKFTRISSSESNDIEHLNKSHYFKGKTVGYEMETDNPKIIKSFLVGFILFWILVGFGISLIIYVNLGINGFAISILFTLAGICLIVKVLTHKNN